MKLTHRDNRLDERLGKRVRVVFWDGSFVEGVVFWQEKFEPPKYLKPKCYHLTTDEGFDWAIRKTHVKRVIEI